MSPHIFLVACEESGDRLGAALIAAIRRRNPEARFSGVGGAQMAALGVTSLFPLGELAIIGFVQIIASLPKIVRRIRDTADAVVAATPDVLVIIDSPEFTHRVARRVRARAPGISTIDYVCPSVWAWRSGRARAMKSYVDHVLALLPFEPKVMRELGGPPCTYVGHPLIEQLDDLRPNAEEARRRRSDPPLLLVLPGSRGGEIRRMANVFGEAVALTAAHVGALEVAVPAVPWLANEVRAAVATWRISARVVVDADEKHAAFRTARAALVKSGTSTLELALAGVPMVTAYKVPLVEEAVARTLLKVNTVILANLVLGEERPVPEFIQRACTAEALATALVPLFADTPERRRQIEVFGRLDGIMGIGKGVPSDRAAAVVLDCAGGLNRLGREAVASAPPKA
ncbi:MAG TPA: lipid-A-disaccharide synthase [Pseudolabrys sp.]|nr:lipid-A-disaccharide synthase [Pseudolabrys sp.]